jgi:hypothetical protein
MSRGRRSIYVSNSNPECRNRIRIVTREESHCCRLSSARVSSSTVVLSQFDHCKPQGEVCRVVGQLHDLKCAVKEMLHTKAMGRNDVIRFACQQSLRLQSSSGRLAGPKRRVFYRLAALDPLAVQWVQMPLAKLSQLFKEGPHSTPLERVSAPLSSCQELECSSSSPTRRSIPLLLGIFPPFSQYQCR